MRDRQSELRILLLSAIITGILAIVKLNIVCRMTWAIVFLPVISGISIEITFLIAYFVIDVRTMYGENKGEKK